MEREDVSEALGFPWANVKNNGANLDLYRKADLYWSLEKHWPLATNCGCARLGESFGSRVWQFTRSLSNDLMSTSSHVWLRHEPFPLVFPVTNWVTRPFQMIDLKILFRL